MRLNFDVHSLYLKKGKRPIKLGCTSSRAGDQQLRRRQREPSCETKPLNW